MTILLTVVLSVLGTLALIYLGWVGLGLRKAQKNNIQNFSDIQGLTHALESVREQLHRQLETEREEVRKRLEYDFRHVHEELTNIQRNIHEAGDRFQRDQDRRFDRIYHKLYTKFPELKDIESPKD
jgi:hypothetical protein